MGLKENIQQETVSRLPLREGIIVQGTTSVAETVELMRESQLGCAVVVDDEGKAVGTFTERTVIDLLLERPASLEELSVSDYVESDWFMVKRDTALCDVCNMIQDQWARFICVVDEDGQPVGLTGQKGVSEYIAEHFPLQVMVQRVGGKRGMENREGA